jgi:hypothetical protein
MAFSTAAVLYPFLGQVESPNGDFCLWKWVDMRIQSGSTFARGFFVAAPVTRPKYFHQQQKSQLQNPQEQFFKACSSKKWTLVVVMISVDQWKAFQLTCCVPDTTSVLRRRIV